MTTSLHKMISLDANKVRVREQGLCIDRKDGTIFVSNDEIVQAVFDNGEAVLTVNRHVYRRLTKPKKIS